MALLTRTPARPSQRGPHRATVRIRRTAGRSLTHVLLLAGGLIWLFPFLWTLGSSFKSADGFFSQGLNPIPEVLHGLQLLECLEGGVVREVLPQHGGGGRRRRGAHAGRDLDGRLRAGPHRIPRPQGGAGADLGDAVPPARLHHHPDLRHRARPAPAQHPVGGDHRAVLQQPGLRHLPVHGLLLHHGPGDRGRGQGGRRELPPDLLAGDAPAFGSDARHRRPVHLHHGVEQLLHPAGVHPLQAANCTRCRWGCTPSSARTPRTGRSCAPAR